MKKSIMFLINGLGVEKAGSYSIDLEECMPNLMRIRETSYFTTAIIPAMEKNGAYQDFFLGDTTRSEATFIKNFVGNSKIKNNPTFLGLKNAVSNKDTKFHIFLEPTNDKIAAEINTLIDSLELPAGKVVYMHLILPQLSENDYNTINGIVNSLKYHMNQVITVGFVIGKEFLSEDLSVQQLDYTKKMFFYCSCERWTETETKFKSLAQTAVRPCDVPGFCTNNDCAIGNGDTLFFFNTKRSNYDSIIRAIYQNARACLGSDFKLETFSLIKLFSKFNIPSFIDNVDYDQSLANILLRNNKKCLFIADDENINTINFYANGMNSINNPIIGFMQKTDDLYKIEYLMQLIDSTPYDLIIFDYHLDVSKTVNDLKEGLTKMDNIIGLLGQICENKHTLIISSLYGLKASIPVADYNQEVAALDFSNQIPIFLFDYEYPVSTFDLFPGETNDILSTAIKCITGDEKLDSLIRKKTIVGSIVKAFIR